MVLLLASPFRAGDAVRLRAGAFGGPIEGTVSEIGITYLRIVTSDGMLSIPNSQVLNAVVGPVPPGAGLPAPPQPAPAAAPSAPPRPASPPATGNPQTAVVSPAPDPADGSPAGHAQADPGAIQRPGTFGKQ